MKNFFELNLTAKDLKENDVNSMEFEAKPLVQGFAVTLGNSLRRVLLTSVLGAAIYAFRINKVEQEFQNLIGCSENVVQIGLNIQKVIVAVDHNVFSNEKEKIILKLHAKGPKQIFAKDIVVPAGVKIINPYQKIVNIVKKDHVLEMEFFVVQSRGFASFQDNKLLTNNEIGTFAVSSNFSHVLKVSVKSEEIKIGQQDVSEKLLLNIKTDGAITPTAALVNAAKILSSHLNFFINLNKKSLVDFHFAKVDQADTAVPKLELKTLEFSERTVNSLEAEGIKYLDQLKNKKQSELLKIKNLGQKSLREIVDRLKQDYKIILED